MRRRNVGEHTSKIERLESRTVFSGGPDFSFGGNGLASISVGTGGPAESKAVTVQADGKTVVAGFSSAGEIALARFNFDGTPDFSFGARHDGTVLQGPGISGYFTSPVCVVSDSAGRILCGGGLEIPSEFKLFAVVLRFTSNGLLDTTFGNNPNHPGVMIASFDGQAWVNSIAVDPRSGKYLLVGGTDAGLFSNSDFLVARLNSDGTNDGSFGNHGSQGYRAVGFGGDEDGTSIALDLQGDAAHNPFYGSIVVAGDAENGLGIARLTPNGDYDSRFGGRDHGSGYDGVGRMLANMYSCAGIVELDDGSLVVSGSSRSPDASDPYDFTMLHLAPNGDPTRFPGSSSALSSVTTDLAGNSRPHRIIRDRDGELVVMGLANRNSTNGDGTLVMAQYKTTGELDTRFGVNGIATAGPVNDRFHREDMAMGPGRRFVVTTGLGFQVARYLDNDANIIGVINPQGNAYEQNRQPASIYVTRSEVLPVLTRVYLSVGGSATSPLSGLPARFWDYTGITAVPVSPPLPQTRSVTAAIAGQSNVCYVDIPANGDLAAIPITPVDDAFREPTEQVVLRVLPDSRYVINGTGIGVVNIVDNDRTATLNSKADASVVQGLPDVPFGTANSLEVRREPSGSAGWTYLKFDLTSLAATNIGSVVVRLYGGLVPPPGSGPAPVNVPVGIFKSTDTSWNESQITWNNKPATTGTRLSQTTIVDSNRRWYSWDVTSFVKSELAAGRTTITLVVKNAGTAVGQSSFSSRESDRGDGPQLFVKYD